ncbi:hypothetical protein K435DRAFT_959078 [Dendrothele bispora CBS 962.96]|uniref:Uncharacterized protein n=1 Tax=Dendrothele bispora (strain CBS 962.96) TaxID=1314807 RepID=A0A4S8MYJ3_DENBC|nr:hypothetical protein K435DRAFT_959078 [Dendrothele bispora CBS 962.96]
MIILLGRVLPPFILPVLVSALPTVTATASNALNFSASACIAIVSTLVFILCVLYVAKRVYRNYRRTRVIRHGPAVQCASLQSSQRSSTSFFYFSDKDKPLKIDHTAFWVGLLGSPRWETSIKASHESGAARYPFINRHPTHGTQKTSSSFGTRLSLTEFGARRRYSSSQSDFAGSSTLQSSSTQTVAPSIQLPAYPANARTTTSPKNRRRSLPTQRQSSEHAIERKKKHSSLNGVGKKRFSEDYAHGSWLRRADPTSQLDSEILPLSPVNSSFLDYPPDLFVNLKSKKRVSGLPTSQPSSSRNSASATREENEGKSFISHPFALIPKNSTGNWEVLPDTSTPCTQESDLQPVSPTITPPAPCFLAPASYVAEMPCSPVVSATLPRRKPKTRSPSVRSRKSPPIGPSPLRIMTLPERSTTNLCALDEDIVRSRSGITSSQIPVQELVPGLRRDMYSQLGIGYPSIWGVDKKEAPLDQMQISTTIENESGANKDIESPHVTSVSSLTSPVITNSSSLHHQDQAADDMLSFIQELVEETSQWDSSLYMDDGFKALMQNPTSRLNVSASQAPVSSSSSSSFPPRSTTSPIHISPTPSSEYIHFEGGGSRSPTPKSTKSPTQSFRISMSRSSGSSNSFNEIEQLVGVLDFDLEVYRMDMSMLPSISTLSSSSSGVLRNSNSVSPVLSPSVSGSKVAEVVDSGHLENSSQQSRSGSRRHPQMGSVSASTFVHGQPLTVLEEANEGEGEGDGGDGNRNQDGHVEKSHSDAE